MAHVRHERDAIEARLAQPAEAEDDDAAVLIRMNRELGEEPHSVQFYATLAPDNPARVFLARQLVRELVTQRRYADAVLGWDVREVNRLFNSSARTMTGASSKAVAAGPEHQHLLLQFRRLLRGAGRGPAIPWTLRSSRARIPATLIPRREPSRCCRPVPLRAGHPGIAGDE